MKKNKIGIIIDSSIGLSKDEADKLGIYYCPIIIEIDGKTYLDGINITNKFIIESFNVNTIAKTAAINLGNLSRQMKKAAQENERVIFIGIARKFSSIYDMALNESKKFKNVVVYDSKFLTPWSWAVMPDVIKLSGENKWDEMLESLDVCNNSVKGYLMPNGLKYLYAGGRISKIQYHSANLLRIYPILTLVNGSINEVPVIKIRTIAKRNRKICDLIIEEYNERIKNVKKGITFEVMGYSLESETFEWCKDYLKSNGINVKVVPDISKAITVHVGPNSMFLGFLEIKNI